MTNYSYSANKLTSSTGEKTFAFDYDSTGNTTVENNKEFIYNQNQRLFQAIDNGITVGEYTHNGNGQRVKKTANGQTTIFHYSIGGQLIAESDNTGMVNAEYVYLNGSPIAKIEGNDVYYYHNDHLGTPMLMTDSSASTVWQGEYLPFGEPYSVTGSITNNLRFPGQYYDSETGLHYNYYRDYNPMIGRYMEADPIGIERGQNHLYVYVGNNPVNFTDPYGLDFGDWLCDIGGNLPGGKFCYKLDDMLDDISDPDGDGINNLIDEDDDNDGIPDEDDPDKNNPPAEGDGAFC